MAHLKLGWEKKHLQNQQMSPLGLYKMLVASKGMQKHMLLFFRGVTSDTFFAGEFFESEAEF